MSYFKDTNTYKLLPHSCGHLNAAAHAHACSSARMRNRLGSLPVSGAPATLQTPRTMVSRPNALVSRSMPMRLTSMIDVSEIQAAVVGKQNKMYFNVNKVT